MMFGNFLTGKLNRRFGKGKNVIVSAGLAAGLLAAVACQAPAQTVEVTREIEDTLNVEVTQEVPVTQQVGVTSQVPANPIVTVTPRPSASLPTFAPTPQPTPTLRPTPTLQPTPTLRPTPTAIPVTNPWIKMANPGDEKSVGFASVSIDHNLEEYYDTPFLSIGCFESGFKGVSVHWRGTRLFGNSFGNSITSTIRFDKGSAEEMSWEVEPENEFITRYATDAERLIEPIVRSDSLFIRVSDIFGEIQEAEFNVSGLSEMMSSEPELCGAYGSAEQSDQAKPTPARESALLESISCRDVANNDVISVMESSSPGAPIILGYVDVEVANSPFGFPWEELACKGTALFNDGRIGERYIMVREIDCSDRPRLQAWDRAMQIGGIGIVTFSAHSRWLQ